MKKGLTTLILSVLVVMISGVAFGETQVGIPSPTRTNAPVIADDQSKLLAAILSRQEMIRSLLEQLTYLQMQLNDIRANQPREPKREDWEDERSYQMALAQYQARVAEWQNKIRMTIASIENLQTKLARAEKELAFLQAQQSKETQQSKEAQQSQRATEAAYERYAAVSKSTTKDSLPTAKAPTAIEKVPLPSKEILPPD